MKALPCRLFNPWKKCTCPMSALRSRSTTSEGSYLEGDAKDPFKSEDFCEEEGYPLLDVKSEENNIQNPTSRCKMESIKTEIHLLNQGGGEVPRRRLSSKQWSDLLRFDSRKARRAYLKRLWFAEQRKSLVAEVQAAKAKLYLEMKGRSPEAGPFVEKDDKTCVQYGLNFNSLFRGIHPRKMNLFYHYRLLNAMIFGPDIVVDCGYDSKMDSYELQRCACDIQQMWMANMVSSNPFNIRFCNLTEDGPLFPRIRSAFPDFDKPELPFNYTSRSYLDLYDKEKLIYLTPYCRTDLRVYEPGSVYIIGAVLNNAARGPVSFAKAKQERLRTARFPLQLADCIARTKSLRAPLALAIMNDLKERHDWRTIFERRLSPDGTSPQTSTREKRSEIFHMILSPKS